MKNLLHKLITIFILNVRRTLIYPFTNDMNEISYRCETKNVRPRMNRIRFFDASSKISFCFEFYSFSTFLDDEKVLDYD